MSKLVLTIDDDKVIHHLVEEALRGSGKVIHAKNGEEGLRKAQTHRPDIILLDVEMPDINGYDVCRTLKEDPELRETPVMFLSAKTDLAERIKGYGSGADDYIVKPFAASELKARIEVLYQYKKKSAQLKKDIKQAQQTAEIAMSDSGDMGRVVRYVTQSYRSRDLPALAQSFLSFFTPFELDVVVAFWCHGVGVYFSNLGDCPLEHELMESQRYAGRFIDFDNNTIVNYPKVSLLVKNMPMDDPALYGRYKDLFPHLLEVTDAKVSELEESELVLATSRKISESFGELSRYVGQLGDGHIRNASLLQKRLAEARKMLAEMEGHGQQAAALHFAELDKNSDEYRVLNQDLKHIRARLAHIMEFRDELLARLDKKAAEEPPAFEEDDIELF